MSSLPQRRVILLVDDNEISRAAYGRVWQHFGYRVLTANRGDDALRVARTRLPDVIILDMMGLPDLPGWEVASILRQDPVTANIPIIALTGLDPRSLPDAMNPNVFDRLLRKPTPPNKLLKVVEGLIGHAAADPPPGE